MVKSQGKIEKSIVKIETHYEHTSKTLVEHDKILNGDPAQQGKGGVIYSLTMVKKDVAFITAGISLIITATVTFVINVFKHKTGG